MSCQPHTWQAVYLAIRKLLDETAEISYDDVDKKAKRIHKIVEIMNHLLSEGGRKFINDSEKFRDTIKNKLVEWETNIPDLVKYWRRELLPEEQVEEPEETKEEPEETDEEYLQRLVDLDIQTLDFSIKGFYDTERDFYVWDDASSLYVGNSNMEDIIDRISLYEIGYEGAYTYKNASASIINLCKFIEENKEIKDFIFSDFKGLVYVLENNLVYYYSKMDSSEMNQIEDYYLKIFGFTIQDKIKDVVESGGFPSFKEFFDKSLEGESQDYEEEISSYSDSEYEECEEESQEETEESTFDKEEFYELYFSNSILTRSAKQFVDKILDLENSFTEPDINAIKKIIDMLCSSQGQGILRNFPDFRNLQIRNMAEYCDFLEYEDFPYVSDKWEDLFGAY